MKKTSGIIPLIGFAGLVLLVACFILFNLPLFGKVLVLLMAGLFFFSLYKYAQHLKEVELEMSQMETLESNGNYEGAKEGTQLHARIAQLRIMNTEGRKINPQVFSDILSARESARVALPGGNTLVILGLLGTFIGLIQVVSEAGNLIQGNGLDTIDSVINVLFKDMRGIFGTTIYGLSASILLNVGQQIWQRTQMRFMARIEEFTQLHLLPAYSVEEEHPVLPALFQLKDEIVGLRQQMGGDWSSLVEKQLGTLAQTLEGVSTSAITGFQKIQNQNESHLNSISEKWNAQQVAMVQSSTDSSEKVFKSFIENAEKTQLSLVENITKAMKEQSDSSANWAEKVASDNSKIISEQLLNSGSVLEGIKDSLATQLETLSGGLSGIPQAIEDMNHGMKSSIDNFLVEVAKQNQEGSVELQKRSETLLASLQENAQSIQSTVQDELQSKLMGITDSFAEVGQLAKENLGAGSEQLKSMQEHINAVTTSLAEVTSNLSDSGRLMKVNQAELQSVMEMFTSGVNQLIESFGAKEEVEEETNNLFDQIEKVLISFQDRSTDILQENALKTQEIMMEVLQRVSVAEIKE